MSKKIKIIIMIIKIIINLLILCQKNSQLDNVGYSYYFLWYDDACDVYGAY